MTKGNRFGRSKLDAHPSAELISGDEVEGVNANYWLVPLVGYSNPMYADGNPPGVSIGFPIDDCLALVIAVEPTGLSFSMVSEQTLDPTGLTGWFPVSGKRSSDPANTTSSFSITSSAFVIPSLGMRQRFRVQSLTGGDLRLRVSKAYSELDIAPGTLTVLNPNEGSAIGLTNSMPVAVEGRSTQKTGVSNGNKVNAIGSLDGKQVVQSSLAELRWSYAIAAGGITTAAAVTIKAAVGSIKNFLSAAQLTNGGATGTEVEIRLGAAGTVIWRGYLPPGGSSNFNCPDLPGSAANQLIELAVLTAGARINGSFQGYTGI